MAGSRNVGGPFHERPCNQSPTSLGSILDPLISGKSRMSQEPLFQALTGLLLRNLD